MKPVRLDADRLVLHERPDAAAVACTPTHPGVWKGQRPMYAAYHARVASSPDGAVAIDYRRQKYGRFYVADSATMSATPMWARARAALFGRTELDIDIAQCHPNLLLHEMEKCQERDPGGAPPFDALEAMCRGREAIFDACAIDAGWLARFNRAGQSACTAKDVLKSLCNIVIFGGSKQTWLNAWVPARPGGGDAGSGGGGCGGGKGEWAAKWRMKDGDYALCAAMEAYLAQIPRLATHITLQDEHGELVAWHQQQKRKQGKRAHPGSCLATVLQHAEAELVLRAMQDFHAAGLTPTVYAYDGFQIKRPRSAAEQAALGAALARANGRREHVEFVVKPWREPIAIAGVTPHAIAWRPSWDAGELHRGATMGSAEAAEEEGQLVCAPRCDSPRLPPASASHAMLSLAAPLAARGCGNGQ